MLALTTVATAQLHWRNHSQLPIASGLVAADEVRGRVLMLDGGPSHDAHLWEWDGIAWTRRAVAVPATLRRGAAFGFDSARGLGLLFGGAVDRYQWPMVPTNDAWLFDGTRWTNVAAANGPSARTGTVMAFDSLRKVLVMFGGQGAAGGLADTWLWDGARWLPMPTPVAPAGRIWHVMSYDRRRDRTVLFGGHDPVTGISRTETWEWDGATWRYLPVLLQPRNDVASLFFDAGSQRTIAVGASPEIWDWDGLAWRRIATPYFGGAPAFRDPSTGQVTLAQSNSGEVRLFHLSDGQWKGPTRRPVGPEGRSGHAMVYDWQRQRLLLFGGQTGPQISYYPSQADMWEWTAGTWGRLPVGGPGARRDHAMAHDLVRGVTVMFGGFTGTVALADTWEWDGVAWRSRSVPGPAARHGHSMAYDAWRGEMLLFGGTSVGVNNDTWSWNGVSWRQLSPAHRPSPRRGAAMAFDLLRGRAVLFGGAQNPAGQSFDSNQTWEWDGVDWVQCFPNHPPPAMADVPMVFDLWRRRAQLVGGAVWEWDGTDWSVASPADSPPWRSLAAAAHDPLRGRTVFFGGTMALGNSWPSADTWELGSLGSDGGPGCTAPTPVLTAMTPARVGGAYHLLVQNIGAGASALVLHGANDQMSICGPLPLDLAPLGLHGCHLRVSAEASRLVPVTNGVAEVVELAPRSPSLVGTWLYTQVLCASPGANAANAVLTNAVGVQVEW